MLIQLPATGSLDATLVGFATTPSVMLWRSGASSYEEHPVVATRTTVHAELPVGTYRITVQSVEASVRGKVEIAAGQVATLTLTGNATGTISGTLRDAATHELLSDTRCVAVNGTDVDAGMSDSTGAYTIKGAVAGPNIVRCGKDLVDHPVTVVAGKSATLDVEVQPPRHAHPGMVLEDRSKQVFVQSVEATGPAARAGIAAGDRLVKIENMPFSLPAKTFGTIVDSLVGIPIPLTLERAGKLLDVTLTIEAE